MTILDVKELSFRYDFREVLKDINLNLNIGEIVCLLGPNGCGKTTLMDCILGINKIEKKKVRIDGEPSESLSISDRAKLISYVPQKHKESFPYTVKEMVMMGRTPHIRNFGSPGKEDEEVVDETLELLGIEDYCNRSYTNLSGGEAQLVMVARALAQQSPVMLMDEPTASLDFKNETSILLTISKLVKKQKKSVLMATHFPNHAFFFENCGIPTRVIMMKDGEIQHEGSPSHIINVNTIRDIYGINSKILTYLDEKNDKLNAIIPVNWEGEHE